MRLGQALKIRELFISLSKEKVGIHTAYKMFRFVKKVESENLPFYTERIREICGKYGDVLPDGQIKITEEKRDSFNQAVAELENIEVEAVEVTFAIEEFADVKISLEDMIVLESLLYRESKNDG